MYSQEISLKIIETTDVHGKLYPYGDIEDITLANVQSYVKKLKVKGENLVLLDNGDILQGDPSVYYYNFINDTVPHLCGKILNYMQYDAASVGNHDIETGHHVYDKIKEEYDFPWLAANAINEKTEEPYFKPYTIFEKAGVKVAVLGMVTPRIPEWLPEQIWKGMYFEDMIVSAKKWISIIQKEKPDLIVGLFHAGVDYSYGNQNAQTEKNENPVRLVAEQVDGFDVIFAGHDHKIWNFRVKSPNGNAVLILGGGSHAKSIAEASITFIRNGEDFNRKDLHGEIVEMKNYTPDQDFLNEFAGEANDIKDFVNETIGFFSKSISSRMAYFGDSEFMDMIHEAQLNVSNADISFAAPLSFSSYIDSGQVIMADMFKLYRFENLLYTMELSGNEIDAYLEYSYDLWLNEMQNKNDHMLEFKEGEKGKLAHPYYNFDSAEGISYTVDLTKPSGDKVTITQLSSGEEFLPDNKYKVAINSYRGNGGGGHLTKGAKIPKEELANRIISSTEKDLRYYMMQWIQGKTEITPICNTNWKFIPDDWYSNAYKKDCQLLFGE